MNLFLPICIAVFNILLVFYPIEILSAARNAVALWFNNVLPTLLPFLIGANILMGLGFVNFLGTILEPVMYPLFGVPGIGGFALACGMASGYPLGAKITSELRENKMISKIEAQRLISFVNNCGPLFIIGTVGASMFNNPIVGYFLLICHYLASITTGLIFKHYKKESPAPHTREKNLFRLAYGNMVKAKGVNNIPAIVSDSVKKSMEAILIIGGYIILFSIIIEMLDIINIVMYIAGALPKFFSLDKDIFKGIIYGLFEITNGAKALSEGGHILPALFVISFGGFSIHMQSINFISKTDINIFVYILSKFIGAIISVLFGILLYPFINFINIETAMVFNRFGGGFFSRLL
ncbi:MAG: sporulation integral membrane protein YlbJ, partial [Clostridiales bacterium]|nr:sporulation integral membrane protein YlbJ [Clostridiales bacterium]